MAELVIRDATDEDEDAILDLVRLSLGEGAVPRTREFWRWKHVANPFGPSYLLVAEESGKIVGLRAFLRWTWWSAGEPVPAVRAVDTVTHPDWRGRGIFTRLTLALVERVRSEGVAFVFNTPNDKSRPGYLKMGWVPVGRLTPWARPVALGIRRADGEAGTGPVAELLDAPGLEAVLDAPDASDPRLATRRDRAYLAWRYAGSPLSYRAAWDLTEDGGAGIVYRAIRRGRRVELRLCEILTGPGPRAARRARGRIAEAARRERAHYVTVLAPPRTPERRIALRGGFLPLPRMGPVLTVRPLNPAPVEPRRGGSWRPSLGALELF